MPDTPSPKPANIIMVLLDELFIPAWNPRKFIDPIELADLVAYIEKGGWVPRILILKRPEGGWWVISGQRRVLAHRKLGKTHIEAEVMDITLDEAKIMAETTNEDKKPYWLDSYENWETLLAENPDWSGRGLADRLGKPKSLVHRATQIMSLLNPASRAMIRESLTSQKPLNFDVSVPNGDTGGENKGKLWELNDGTIRQLLPLLTGREKAEAQALAEKAVKIILDRRMTGPKAAELVSWINAGGLPEEFGTAKSAPKKSKSVESPVHAPIADTSAEPAQTHPAHLPPKGGMSPSGNSAPAHTTTPAAHSHSQSVVPNANGQYKEPLAQSNHAPQPVASAQVKVYMFRDWVSGVKVIPQLKHKVEKGQTLTFAESMVLGGYRLGEGLHWLWKEMLKPTLKSLSEKLKKTLGKTLYTILIVLVLIYLAGKVWRVFQAALHPIRWIESKFHHEQPAVAPIPTAEPTPLSTVVSAKVIVPSAGATSASANGTVSNAVPTATITPVKPPPTAHADVAGQVLKQVAPDVAGDVAKKLFGL